MTALAPDDCRIEVGSDWRPLEAHWRRLEESGTATAFQRYDWVAAWYAVVGGARRAEPLIVTVRPPGSADPVLILPLARHREQGLRVIGFADQRVADYVAPVMAADLDLPAAAFDRLWRRIVASLPPCDLIRLRKIPAEVFGRPNPLGQLPGIAAYPTGAYGLPLGKPWCDQAREAMGSRTFRKLRSARRNLEALGTLAFQIETGTARATELFDLMVSQRRSRFASLGREDALADPVWHDFYRATVTGGPGRPIGVLSALMLDGEPRATNFGIVFRSAFHDLAQGFEPGPLDRHSPGLVLNAMNIEWAAAQGLAFYDFTLGDEPYKRRMGAQRRDLLQWMAPRSPLGWLAYGAWRLSRRQPPAPVA